MEFIETPLFSKIRESYFGDIEFHMLQLHLIDRPDAGDLIVGTGGATKLRWGIGGRGKRGGVRVIYYWITKDHQILLITVYAKNEASDISPATKKAIKKMIGEL
ncbi:MAG: transcriptional regulator [Proteobacteria bacterium]|nr:transcriptional regulator [Pseudomonadota bacterium]